MVRIASFLVAGCAHAGETGSLMQSHNAELGTAMDVNFRLSKLADLQLTTKRMEAEYKAMAHAIINKQIDPKTGNPYTAPRGKDMWTTVEEQFDVLLLQLDEEKKTNEALIVTANQKVKDCNTARDGAYSAAGTGVDALLTKQQNARVAHTACRNSENGKIEERKDSCGRFVGQKLCEAHENKYDYFTKSTYGDYQSVPEALLKAVREAKECKSELAAEVSQSATCDGLQDVFEFAFCQYDMKLTDTCTTLDTCYDQATTDRAQVVASVTELEKNQKVVYRMVQKVICYVNKMKSNFKTLTTEMIESCEQTSHADAADARLTVDKPAAVAKKPCDKSLLAWGAPGDASWKAHEYSAKNFTEHHGETYHGSADAVSIIENIVSCNDMENLAVE